MLRLLKISIETNLFIAFAAVAFLWSNIYLLDLYINSFWILSLQVFFSTWFVYQISRWIYYKKGEYTNQEELIVKWFQKHPKFNKITIYGSAVLTLVFTLFLKLKTIGVLCIIGGISVLYPIPVLKPFGVKTKLRDFPFIKIFLIAFVWSTTSVILPLTESYEYLANRKDVLVVWLAQFIFILFITIPFDINDAEDDKASNMKTIPAVFGIKASKIIALVLGIIYAFMMLFVFMLVNWNHSPNKYLPDATIILIWILLTFLQLYTFYRSEKVTKWMIKVVYDGSMIVYFLIVYITKLVLHLTNLSR